MKALFLLVSALALGVSALASETKIRKVSKGEAARIRHALETGNWASPHSGEGDCDSFRRALPSTFIQGFVDVPEDVGGRTDRMIKVFYYGRMIEGKDPVVFYNGGPGSDSHGSYQTLLMQPGAQELSFIFIDQRGTGCSTSFPEEYVPETLRRLLNYGSRGIVLDSEAVREKVLGPKGRWKIFGQSYGGRIVHRYLMMDTTHVLAAYAHGYSLMDDGDEWMVMRIQSQVRVLEEYLKMYPGDAATLRTLQGKIAEDRCFTDGDLRVCGPRVLDGLVMYLGFSYTWPNMHQLIQGMLAPNGELNEGRLTSFVRQIVFGAYGNNYVAGSVIGMGDMSVGHPKFDFCSEPLRRLKARGENPDAWVLNECRLLGGMTNEKWDPWLREMEKDLSVLDETRLADFRAALERAPQVPFYLYAGQLDVFVPMATFTEEAELLGPLVHFTVFPNSGHEGFYSERQVWQDLKKSPGGP